VISRATLAAFALASLGLAAPADDFRPQPRVAGDLPRLFQADFESGGLDEWEPTDRAAWRISEVDGDHVLDQFQASRYEPKVRSPFNYALIPGVDVDDFVLDLDVRSTTRDYDHRDVCLVFDYQDPSHFHYVHLGKKADEHAHSIFLVDDQPRVSIAEERTDGTPWTDGRHHVRLVRGSSTGLIQVYFDDMDKPIMTANDRTFGFGRIGVGTFDDTAQFDSVQVWGKRHAR
jgi:hypothetical protein